MYLFYVSRAIKQFSAVAYLGIVSYLITALVVMKILKVEIGCKDVSIESIVKLMAVTFVATLTMHGGPASSGKTGC